jgi:hypothetical protein
MTGSRNISANDAHLRQMVNQSSVDIAIAGSFQKDPAA